MVEDLTTGQMATFVAQRWIARDEDDGKLEIDIAAGASGLGDMAGLLKVTVYTANKRNAGTNARVFVELDSEQGDLNSGRINLDGTFEAGDVDINNVKLTDQLSPVGTER